MRELYALEAKRLNFLSRRIIQVAILPVLAVQLLRPCPALAEPQGVASLYAAEGEVAVRRAGSQDWGGTKTGDQFREGDTIRTGTDGKAALQFVDGALVRLGRFSALTFEKVSPAGNPAVTHTEGKAYFFSRGARREPEIRTKNVNAAIFGTELVVETSAAETTIDVLHGTVNAFNAKGSVSLSPGERATALAGEAPTKSILVRPAESVQWMVNFPMLLVESDFIASPDPGCPASCALAVRQALNESAKGRSLLEALQGSGRALEGTQRGAILRAIGLWRAGAPAAAEATLGSLQGGGSPTDNALRELVAGFTALVRGNTNGANERLQAAVAYRPGLANEQLLKSYVLQSRGDLEGALAAISLARQEHPKLPALYDREAELLLSFNRYDDATALLADRQREFGHSAMNSVLAGFAALARHEFAEAEADFTLAQREDPSQSLAYLGQALVKVNDQDYAATKELLSKAVQLDPAVSSYRSYLGKLFFDDEHSDKARQEYNAAIELDENDPTPFLYRSYVDVAQNDVIGGLADVEQSIKLNNNRAVYRSSLMLDRDLAVRGAGLSRVFTELGFDQIARVEAVKSISDDYSNFSAHRLLSDAYESIIDVDARVSEDRIANLLSPLSFNIFNSIGESVALGDYNALFDKKENREAVSARWVSNQNQVGAQLLTTGKTDTFGWLFRYQPFYLNTSQNNAHQAENRIRGAIQYEVTPDDRLVLEGNFNSYSDRSSDSIPTSAGPVELSDSSDVKLGNVLLGYNHRFSAQTTLLVQGEYARDSSKTSVTNDNRQNFLSLPSAPEDYYPSVLSLQQGANEVTNRGGLSAQVIYASKYVDSVSGAQGLYVDPNRQESSPLYALDACGAFEPPCAGGVNGLISTSASTSLTSGTAYEYLSLKIPQRANLTLGLAATSVQYDLTEVPPFLSGRGRESKLDPKIGLLTTPTSWLTTRAAYFETLGKSVLEDQSSLEPTLVGGLNQDFNDLPGAESRNYAFGLDAKLPNVVYAGAQYTHRNIREPLGDVSQLTLLDGDNLSLTRLYNGGFLNSDSESQLLRSYIYGVLTESTVLTADSLINWYNLTDPGESPGYIDTRRLRLGARQYWGKHLSFTAQGTYRNQDTAGIQSALVPGDLSAGGGFWLFDAAVSYRFPEQHGNLFFRVDNVLNRSFEYDQSPGIEPLLLEGRSFILGVNYNFF